MKKLLNLAMCFAFLMFGSSLFAQDTVVGWTFPSTSADSIVDVSISLNASRYLSCQYGTWAAPSYHGITSYYILTGADGGTDKCASSVGWNDGADSVYWMVKFKTTGYQNLQLSSKMSSNAGFPGPRDFKAQYKLPGSGNPWVDITGGTFQVAADWTTGVLTNVSLPAALDNQGGQVSVRWLQTSNFDINGGTLAATGVSMLDNIVVTGQVISGVDMLDTRQAVSIYPNPCKGSFYVENADAGCQLAVFNMTGSCVFAKNNVTNEKIELQGFVPGFYVVKITNSDNETTNFKLIVE
ncbi:MAG: T9SS type A sorting domain-containing protein [Bacteroidota bacterium]